MTRIPTNSEVNVITKIVRPGGYGVCLVKLRQKIRICEPLARIVKVGENQQPQTDDNQGIH